LDGELFQMNVMILAGGYGTRLAEETETIPKPMVEIGGRPILWHILRHYAHYGFCDFHIALGYKGHVIKRYFSDYCQLQGSISVDLGKAEIVRREEPIEDWRVHLIDTGRDTNTGGRVAQLAQRLTGESFMLTYGDGVSDVDLRALLAFHKSHGRAATVTAVRPPARFGGIRFDGDQVVGFSEKSQVSEGWINGGFFVFEPEALDYVDNNGSLEFETLERLAADNQLAAFKHEGFWQCMDTLRDKNLLQAHWDEGTAPWKVWE
jgi:glucose-1-phosphate cytidylyltransferase